MHKYRTHTCGELRGKDASVEVRLSGWVFRKRDHGSLMFIDLRDHYGVTQVVIKPDREFFDMCQRLRFESVITVTGIVTLRSEDTINRDLPTGEIELVADQLVVDCMAEQTPIYLAGDQDDVGPEDLRLRYRFLDLRRSKMQANISLRSSVISSLRKRMLDLGFNEIQTPILTCSSPEGARDYLVPSRLHPGKFYALPQAPQLFKQLLMVAGMDRYFQIAPCFRDEDARADRSPGEFYQLDIEMSFVEQEDVLTSVESVLGGLFCEFAKGRKVDELPFKRIPYREAMLKYGSDKPDLRIPIEICDVSDLFKESKFNAFRSVVEKGGVVRAIPVGKIAEKPRSFFDKMVEFAQSVGSKGLGYLIWEDGQVKGPIAKFLSENDLKQLAQRCNVGSGDVVFFVSDMANEANRIAGEVRVKLGQDLDLIDKNVFRFCWITDFPMFEKDDTGSVIFSHNPFSMPQGGMDALEKQDPLSILAYQYDVVCNGVELSSGAIRNHKPEIMYKAFEIAGYSKSAVEEKFAFMLNAFKFGPPPHGGIAPGIDRIVMLLANETNIREVIAFPMNQKAQDLMMNAPSNVSEKQLRELHIKLDLPKDKAEAGI